MFKKLINKNLKRGFTLLEIIVTVSLISIGLTSIVALTTHIMIFSSFNSSKLIAAYLAQEGIEIVRNIRENNWLAEDNWRNGLDVGEWEADYHDTYLSDNYDGDYLNIDSNGFYSYSSGQRTKFQRKITIRDIDTHSFKVTVEIFWKERGKNHSLVASEILYNWKP